MNSCPRYTTETDQTELKENESFSQCRACSFAKEKRRKSKRNMRRLLISDLTV